MKNLEQNSISYCLISITLKEMSRMKRILLLALLLLFVFAAGCTYSAAAQERDIAPEATGEPPATPAAATGESLAGAVPAGFIKNEAGATDEEMAAIFAAEKSTRNVESLAEQGAHLYIYARQDWHDGALLLAGVAPMGELPAELYFVSGGEVVTRTSVSDIWSLNYTHYQGETIVFGPSFAWDNGPLATDEVQAEFWNGETVTVPMKYIPNGESEITRGYICVTPSLTWLKSLKIVSDGKTLADDGSGWFLTDPSNQPWYGEPESIRNRTRYVRMPDVWPDEKTDVVDDLGGIPTVTLETPGEGAVTCPLEYWPGCTAHEGISPDIWHSNNSLPTLVDAKAGSRIAAGVMAEPDSFDASQKVSDFSVNEVYWADLSVKDDEKCITQGELVCPTKQGFYILVVVTDYGCFIKTLRIV